GGSRITVRSGGSAVRFFHGGRPSSAGAAIPPAGHRARHTALLLRPTPHARVDAAETGWRVLEHGGGTDPFASARTRLEGTRAAWPDAHPGIRQLRRRQRQGPLVALRTCTGGNCRWTR